MAQIMEVKTGSTSLLEYALVQLRQIVRELAQGSLGRVSIPPWEDTIATAFRVANFEIRFYFRFRHR